MAPVQSKIAPIPSSEAFANATDDDSPQLMAAPPALVVHDDPGSHAFMVASQMRWDDYDRHLDVVWDSLVEDWFDREDILRWGEKHCRGILYYIGHQNQMDVNNYLNLIQSVIPQEELRALSELSVEEVFCEDELKFPGKKLLQYVLYSIRDPTIGLEEHLRLDEQISHKKQKITTRHNIDLGAIWLQNFYNTTGETFEQFAIRSLADVSQIPANLFKAIERFTPGLLQDPASQGSAELDEVKVAEEPITPFENSPVNLDDQGDSETHITQTQAQSTPKDKIDSQPVMVDSMSKITQDTTNMTPDKCDSNDSIVEASTTKISQPADPSSAIVTSSEASENLPAGSAMQTSQVRFIQPRSRDNRRISVGSMFPPHHINTQSGPSSTPVWRHRGQRRDIHSDIQAPNIQLQQPPTSFYTNAPGHSAIDRGSPGDFPGFSGLMPPSQPFGVAMVNAAQQQVRYTPYIQPQGTYIHGAAQPSYGFQFGNPGGYQTEYLPTYGAGEMVNQPFFFPQDYIDVLPIAQSHTPTYTHPSNRPRNNSMGRGRRGRAYSGVSNDNRALYNPRTGVLDYVDNYGQPAQSYGSQSRGRVNNFGQERNYYPRVRNHSLGQDRGHHPCGSTIIGGRRFSRSARPNLSHNAGPATSPQATSNSMAAEAVTTSSGPVLTQACRSVITENPPRMAGSSPPLKSSTSLGYSTEQDFNDARQLMHSNSTGLEAGEIAEYELYDSPTRKPKLTSSRRNSNRNPHSGKTSKMARTKGKDRSNESDVNQESFNINNEKHMDFQSSSKIVMSGKTPLHKIQSGNAAASMSEGSSDVDGTLRRTSEGDLIFEFQAAAIDAEPTDTTVPTSNVEKTTIYPEVTPKPIVAIPQLADMHQNEAADIQTLSKDTKKSSTPTALDLPIAVEHSIGETTSMANKESSREHPTISERINKIPNSEPAQKSRTQTTQNTKTKNKDEKDMNFGSDFVAAVADEDVKLELKDDTTCQNDGVDTVPMKITQNQDVLKEKQIENKEKIPAVTLADWQAAPAQIQKREAEEVKAFTDFYKKKLAIDTNPASTSTTKLKPSSWKFEETFKQTAIEGSMGPRRVLSKTKEQILDRGDAEVQLSPKHEAAKDVVTFKIDTTETKAIAVGSTSTQPKLADETSADTSTATTLTEDKKSVAVELEKSPCADDKDNTPSYQETCTSGVISASSKASESMVSTHGNNKNKGKQIGEPNESATTAQDKSQKPKMEVTESINPFAVARKQALQAKLQAKAAKKKEKKQQQQKHKSSEKVAVGTSVVMDNKETEAGSPDIVAKFAADEAEGQAKCGPDEESPKLGKDLSVPIESATSIISSEREIEATTEHLTSTMKTEDVAIASTSAVVEPTTMHTPVEHQSGHGDDTEERGKKKQPTKKKKSNKRKKKSRKSSGDSTIEALSDVEAKESRTEHGKPAKHKGRGEIKYSATSSTLITSKAGKEIIEPAFPLASFSSGVKGSSSSGQAAPTDDNADNDLSSDNHLSETLP